MRVRNGLVALEDIMQQAEMLEAQLEGLLKTSVLPEHPADAEMEAWVVQVYKDQWGISPKWPGLMPKSIMESSAHMPLL
jgi:hypothetical protein